MTCPLCKCYTCNTYCYVCDKCNNEDCAEGTIQECAFYRERILEKDKEGV